MVDPDWLKKEFHGCSAVGEAGKRLGHDGLQAKGLFVHEFSDSGWYLVDFEDNVWVAPGIICYLEVAAGNGQLVVNDRDDGYIEGPIQYGDVLNREFPSHAELKAKDHVVVLVRVK